MIGERLQYDMRMNSPLTALSGRRGQSGTVYRAPVPRLRNKVVGALLIALVATSCSDMESEHRETMPEDNDSDVDTCPIARGVDD